MMGQPTLSAATEGDYKEFYSPYGNRFFKPNSSMGYDFYTLLDIFDKYIAPNLPKCKVYFKWDRWCKIADITYSYYDNDFGDYDFCIALDGTQYSPRQYTIKNKKYLQNSTDETLNQIVDYARSNNFLVYVENGDDWLDVHIFGNGLSICLSTAIPKKIKWSPMNYDHWNPSKEHPLEDNISLESFISFVNEHSKEGYFFDPTTYGEY